MFEYFNKAKQIGPMKKIANLVNKFKPKKEYTIGDFTVKQEDVISEGGYGYVYLAHEKDHFDNKFALKKIMVQDKINYEAVQRETTLWAQLEDSPYLCKYLGHIEHEHEGCKEVIILCEY